MTDEQGRVSIELLPNRGSGRCQAGSQLRRVEFSVTDASDQEITGSSEYIVHNAGIYPGAPPDKYVGQAGRAQIAHFILVVVTTKQPKPDQAFEVDISQIAGVQTGWWMDTCGLDYKTTIDEDLFLSTLLSTGADGETESTWTPPNLANI